MSNGISTLQFSEWITTFFELMYLTSTITVRVAAMFVCRVVLLTILIADVHWAPRGLVTITKKPARDLKESMDYFIIMIYLFFYWIKLHNAIIWFLFELYSKKIFFTQWVKTKFPFPLNVLSHIPSTKIPVPVDQIPFSHPYFRPIPVPFCPFRALLPLRQNNDRPSCSSCKKSAKNPRTKRRLDSSALVSWQPAGLFLQDHSHISRNLEASFE